MKNYVQSAALLTMAVHYDVASGGGVLVGSIFGVAQGKALTGETVVLVREGVFDLAKTSAQAWTVGAKIYWDDTNKVATTTASGNTLIGAALEVAENPSAVGRVIVDGAIR